MIHALCVYALAAAVHLVLIAALIAAAFRRGRRLGEREGRLAGVASAIERATP